MTTWRKSSYTDAQSPDCVELAELDGIFAIRDSKHPENPHLSIDRATLGAFIHRVRKGELDRD